MTSPAFKVVIPARYASSRLPGKPLRELAGRSLLEWVYGRARDSGAEQVVIATDDARIERAAQDFGAIVCMTDRAHQSGTDRLAEVVQHFDWPEDTIVVNLQGDEPLMPPALIDHVAADLDRHGDAAIATLCSPLRSASELTDSHVVKVVRDAKGYALYFSRAPIPWNRDEFADGINRLSPEVEHLRHIGLYAYRASFLRDYAALAPSFLERTESLEQLRALWHGHRIHVALAPEAPGPGVDTEADLAEVERLLAGQPASPARKSSRPSARKRSS